MRRLQHFFSKVTLKKALIILLISLILTEILLRLFGFRPGYWGKFQGFYPVDSLVVYQNYTTDDYGIYKFSSWITDSLKYHYNWKKAKILENTASYQAVLPSDMVNYIYTTTAELKYQGQQKPDYITKKFFYFIFGEEDWNTEFTQTYNKIKKQKETNGWEAAIKDYVNNPFNQDGFRSIAFHIHDTSRIRILLIGDSFAYGMDARPFFNSYSDILLSRGYEVYNTGIPGVDPAQYAAIALKYVPLLKPDIVLLNFCDHEDLMYFSRKAEYGRPHEHVTNAGTYGSYPLGKYLSAKETYDYYSSLIRIPDVEKIWYNKASAYLTITSLGWGFLYKKGYLPHPPLEEYYNFQNSREVESAIPVTKKYLTVIDSICDANDVTLFNIIIPDRAFSVNLDAEYFTIDKRLTDSLFTGIYYSPDSLFTPGDYYRDEDHFNNAGSLKFADFIESIIQRNYQLK